MRYLTKKVGTKKLRNVATDTLIKYKKIRK